MGESEASARPIILVAESVLNTISADAERFAGRVERGGILIGLRRGPHIEIKEATLPMRWDISSMFSFRRSARGHQAVALRRWRESQRTLDWVGEWHSHPQSYPTPSGIDADSWKALVTRRVAPMAFLIVGYRAQWVGLSIPGEARPIKYIERERTSAGVAYVAE